MSAPIISELTATVQNTVGVMKSATVLVNGIADKIKVAVEQALANGATEAELQPLIALEAELENEASALSSAVSTNS